VTQISLIQNKIKKNAAKKAFEREKPTNIINMTNIEIGVILRK